VSSKIRILIFEITPEHASASRSREAAEEARVAGRNTAHVADHVAFVVVLRRPDQDNGSVCIPGESVEARASSASTRVDGALVQQSVPVRVWQAPHGTRLFTSEHGEAFSRMLRGVRSPPHGRPAAC